jgi:hypothetical protein
MRKHDFKYCTYTHSINGFVFYVGHGTFNRPYEKGRRGKDRNESWFDIVEDNNWQYEINIVFKSDNKEECLNEEIRLTEFYKSKGEAIANKNIGNHIGEEQKKLLSSYAQARVGDKNPFYGKHHSEETIAIIREKNIGRIDSPEANKKKAHYGTDNPFSHACVVVFDNGTIKEYDMIKDLMNDIGCQNASAYARGALGKPKHYWKSGQCYIYYKEDFTG